MDRTDSGILIAVEGIDGAGKTTQANLLAEFFTSAGEEIVRSKEPTDGPWGRKIRASAATGRMSPADELHAFTEDRKEHVRDLLLPALRAGKIVILDRYFYSTIAYQGANGLDAGTIAADMFATFPTPDAVLLVDVPPAVGLARIVEGRGEKPNAFEQLEHLQDVRQIFLALAAKHDNIAVIDGTQSIVAVRQALLRSLLDGVLKKRYCTKAYGCDDPLSCSDRINGTCRWADMCQRVAALT
jgi:dTMP kinase